MSKALLRGRAIEGYVLTLVVVALVTVVIGELLHLRSLGTLPMLYLLAVLIAAIRYGRGPAIAASIASFLAYDFFYVEPVHTLTITVPDEWLALALFLIVAILTAQLAAREREQGEEAKRRAREAILLRGIGVTVAESEPDWVGGLRAVEARLRAEFDLDTAAVVLGEVAAGALTTGDEEEHGRFPLLVPGGDRIGLLRVTRSGERGELTAEEQQLLGAVATQLASMLERLRLRREANEAEALRRTDELKSALLNAVSHDLRTPIASILASAGSLLQCDVDWTEEERDDFARAIVEESERLNSIVGNLLDLSRIEGGSLRPDKSWHDLHALIAAVVRRIGPRYPRHFFAIDVPDTLPPLYIDWVEIDQTLSNLIENAAKYSPPETKVWIAARADGNMVRVQVADRGPGLPPAALPNLFTPFYRVIGPSGQAPTKGIGLGLAVARGLVEAHGGTIMVRNRDDGGALFTFTLPIMPRAAGLEERETPLPAPIGTRDVTKVNGERHEG
jgi:two-component system sensor histidine kinase KdpD